MFLPNRDTFYNTETKRLHAGIFSESGALDSPGKELGDYTFNLVRKTYPFAWVIQLLTGGSPFYPVQNFATEDTVNRLLALVRFRFPALSWNSLGNEVNPTEIKEQVFLTATDKDGMTERFSSGQLAFTLMTQGETFGLGLFKNDLNQAFGVQ